MPVGLSANTANNILNCIGNNVTYTGITQCFIKLHVGDPGAAGTANPALELLRVAVSFGNAASGTMSNDALVEWSNITGSQNPTHYTLWTDLTAGTFVASGLLNASEYTAGDIFTILPGDIDLTFTLAS